MTIMSDNWISKKVKEERIIEPFESDQVKEGKISYGLSSYGYDARVADEFKIFTNVNNALVDPKNFSNEGFVERTTECQIPNSNVYDRSMFVGRIQINLNDGKKRKFLYFQSDYTIMQTGGKIFEPDS